MCNVSHELVFYSSFYSSENFQSSIATCPHVLMWWDYTEGHISCSPHFSFRIDFITNAVRHNVHRLKTLNHLKKKIKHSTADVNNSTSPTINYNINCIRECCDVLLTGLEVHTRRLNRQTLHSEHHVSGEQMGSPSGVGDDLRYSTIPPWCFQQFNQAMNKTNGRCMDLSVWGRGSTSTIDWPL